MVFIVLVTTLTLFLYLALIYTLPLAMTVYAEHSNSISSWRAIPYGRLFLETGNVPYPRELWVTVS